MALTLIPGNVDFTLGLHLSAFPHLTFELDVRRFLKISNGSKFIQFSSVAQSCPTLGMMDRLLI